MSKQPSKVQQRFHFCLCKVSPFPANSHTATLAAATVSTGQAVIEEDSPEPRPRNELLGMQTHMLLPYWGVTLGSSASNPRCSWVRLCRNVLFTTTQWLEFSKHLRVALCVTEKQTLHFTLTPFVAFVTLCYVIAALTLGIHFICCWARQSF